MTKEKKEEIYQNHCSLGLYRTLLECLRADGQVALKSAVEAVADPTRVVCVQVREAMAIGHDATARAYLTYLIRACEDEVNNPLIAQHGRGNVPRRDETLLEIRRRAAKLFCELLVRLPSLEPLRLGVSTGERELHLMPETRRFLFTVIAKQWRETKDTVEAEAMFAAFLSGFVSGVSTAKAANNILGEVFRELDSKASLERLAEAGDQLNQWRQARCKEDLPDQVKELDKELRVAYARNSGDDRHRNDLALLGSALGLGDVTYSWLIAQARRASEWERRVRELYLSLRHSQWQHPGTPKGDIPRFDPDCSVLKIEIEFDPLSTADACEIDHHLMTEKIIAWRDAWPDAPRVVLDAYAHHHDQVRAWARKTSIGIG